MGRPKKNKDLHSDVKPEVKMTDTQTLEAINHEEQASQALESMETELDRVRLELEQTKRLVEEKRAELKAVGRDAQEQRLIDKQLHTIVKNEGLKDKIDKQKAYDSVKVTGRFMNRRNPGQTVKLPYVKYAEDPAVWHTFREGATYTIPRGFADQINGGDDNDPCYYTPQFIQKTGDFHPSSTTGENSQIANVDTSNKRYAFVPIGFN